MLQDGVEDGEPTEATSAIASPIGVLQDVRTSISILNRTISK